MTSLKKNLYIRTYGCQMNVYDSQRMGESLQPLGFQETEDPENAHLMIINTCHIRAKAEDKLYSDLGRLRLIKARRQQEGDQAFIVVAGCVGQALGKAIIKRAPYVDAIVGPQTYHTLPETVAKLLRETGQHISVGFPKIEKFDELPQDRALSGPHAFLTIQEGCNKFCRYCVVPFTRGPEYSRPVHDVVAEARQLVDKGAREITLLGQNVNAYHGIDEKGTVHSLAHLIHKLSDIHGLLRLRYTTSHPRDVDEDLIAAHRDVKILMPFLHLPVQSGSDRVLAHMNRRHTAEFYLDVIKKLREARPDMGFSSDFIVGYPGETDEEFQATCDLVDRVEFAQAFSFKYSPRPGTPAAMAVQLPESVKDARLILLQKKINDHRQRFNEGSIGQTMDVLIEGKRRHQWMGRSPFMQSVYFQGPEFSLGDMVSVHIQQGFLNSLEGVLQESDATMTRISA
jgi:tRNA-2-methylthio-N6-dimethylallyladenosine synthase